MKKTYVITGGTSGIGLEIGRQLAALGHHVVLLGRDAAKGSAAAAAIVAAGGSAEAHSVDLSTQEGTRSAAERLSRAHPAISGLVHAAGVLTREDVRTPDGLHV